MNRIILLVIVLLLFFAVLPTWPYSSGWGYYPGGGVGLILLIILLALVFWEGWEGDLNARERAETARLSVMRDSARKIRRPR